MKGTAALLTVGLALTACTALPSGDDPTGIEGMSPADVVSAFEADGLECGDPAKSFESGDISFTCVDKPNVSAVDGSSITIDEMAIVTIRVDDGNRDDAKRLANTLLGIPYEGSDPEAARAWLSERLASDECVQDDDCNKVFGAARLTLQFGLEGSLSIRIYLEGLNRSSTPAPGETG